MIDALKIKFRQGYQTIRDIRQARISDRHRGFPILRPGDCGSCSTCQQLCPSGAINPSPGTIDLGRCVFCGDCERQCPQKKIHFGPDYKTATDSREHLVIDQDTTLPQYRQRAIVSRPEIHRVFGRSLKLRQISAGGCNACELELNAGANVNFDMGRFGIDWVASPRHADGLVISGPITTNMVSALKDTYLAIPDPKLVVLTGACAISGGVFSASSDVDRAWLQGVKVDLYVPGCPVHPLTFINGLLDLLAR